MMKSVTRNLLLAVLVVFVAVGAVKSGEQLQVYTGEAAGDRFGHSVASAGDVNNDGYDDIIVGAYTKDAGGPSAGRAYVYSGLNGEILFLFDAETDGDQIGISVASAGDVNNDGYGDLIVGANQNDAGGESAGRAYVFSGLNGDTLHIFTGENAGDIFATSVASAGDVNNDGFDDLIVGAPHYDAAGLRAGRAYVFSGSNGDVLHVFSGESSGDLFGYSVASAGDVNNDGFDDLIIGASSANDAGVPMVGRAYVFSGMNGEMLFVFKGESAYDFLGKSVASAGDVNNDGYADLIIGVPGCTAFGVVGSGGAYVFSGQNGDTLQILSGESTDDHLGISVASAGDVDGDGFDDLIVGSYSNGAGGKWAGRAYVYSGQTGGALHIFTGEEDEAYFGFSVASAGDINNDGIGDLVVGAFLNDGSGIDAGLVHVYSGVPAESCCEGFAGSVDGDPDDLVNIADLTVLIDHLFINFPALECPQEGNMTGDLEGVVDITDLTHLIDHLFINFPAIAPCQNR